MASKQRKKCGVKVMIIWLPIMYALKPDQNLNLQEDMWHYYMTTTFIHRNATLHRYLYNYSN